MSMLDAALNLLTPDLISRLSAKTGESDGAVAKCLRAVIPMLLASVAARSGDSGFMNQLAGLASRAVGPDASSQADAWANLTGAETTASAQGWLTGLFGDALPTVVNGLSRHAGVKHSTASSILTFAAPIVLGYLGRQMRTENLDTHGLARRLALERDSFASAIPPDLGALVPGFLRTPATGAAPAGVGAVQAAASRGKAPAAQWLLPALLAVALAGGGLFWWFANGRSADEVRTKVTSGAVGTAGSVLDFMTKTLPGNVSLHVPRGGMEDRLADYLGTASAEPARRDFEFDRIGFETGSAVLTAASREQLRNIAAILGAYPQAHVTIAGYTDNVGAEPVNMDLSRTRADSVMHALREMGVAPDRMEARGYGSENPLASNDTEEGRARNRRVALMVSGR